MKLFELKWICKGNNGDYIACSHEYAMHASDVWHNNKCNFQKGWLVSVTLIQNEKGEKI